MSVSGSWTEKAQPDFKAKPAFDYTQSAIPTMNPSYQKFDMGGATKIPASSGFQQPKGDLTSAIKTYESIGDDYKTQDSNYVYDGGGDDQSQDQDSWRNRLYAERAAAQSAGGSYYGGQQQADQKKGTFKAIDAPDMPTFVGDEYAPPEQDSAIYDAEREKAIRPGLRALREGTTEAISSSQSLDNPNARSMFIKRALHGYGQGLEGVAAQAGREATGRADKKYQQQLDIYRTKYEYKRSADLVNYQSQVSQIAQQFAADQQANIMNYQEGAGQYANQSTGTTGSSQYPNQTRKDPFMGYMS